MTNDKPFQPEFGPNGAVMNAPTMTPEVKEAYEDEAPAKRSLLRSLRFPLWLLTMVALQLLFKPLPDAVWIATLLGMFVLFQWLLPRPARRKPGA